MSRIIVIDSDTAVGYLYLTKNFYVINKGTRTYRKSVEDTLNVLNIVAPDNTVTAENLEQLRSTNEVITGLSYTLHDSGAYVSSIQINDYTDYPIVLDSEKQVLYVLNTSIVFNLAINESRDTRITLLMNYYLDTLGIEITREQFTLIYNFLISMYMPYVYNVITDTSTTPILYSNIFTISNWNNKSVAVYNCTVNPNNTFTKKSIGDIVAAEPSTNTIYFQNYTGNLKEGDTIYVEGATTKTDTYTYTVDGEYTVQNLDTVSTPMQLITTTALSSSYVFPYPKAYLQLAISNIESINRETGTITLSADVSDIINNGDIIEVSNTQEEIEGTTISCNGTYIVASIEENVITVQNTLPTNYTYTSQEVQGVLSKNVFIGNVNSIVTNEGSSPVESVITLTKNSLENLTALQHTFVEYNNTRTYFVIQTVNTQQTFTCITSSYTGTTPLHAYTPTYPKLQEKNPDTDILIQVTKTQNKEIFPTGEFMVDNFEQCREYIGLYNRLSVPSYTMYNNVGKEVGGNIEISPDTLPTCTYLGLFSQVYTESNA